MPHCPRCKHPAPTAPTVCTQCGTPVPAEQTAAPATSPAKLWLGVAAALLAAGLIGLAIFYLSEVNRLVR